MRIAKILFILFMVGTTALLHAQSKRGGKKRPFRMSQKKSLIVCPVFEVSKYPYHGIGFKLGDPFALTYKFYPSPHWAVTADAGVTASGLYSSYYKKIFPSYLPKDLSEDESISYITHKIPVEWFFEIKFLYNRNITAIHPSLHFYAGLGWQARFADLNYDYAYTANLALGNDARVLRFETQRVTHGVVGVIGFEYAQFSIPISAFIETALFVDTFSDPGYRRFQGGIGLRYIF